MLALAHLAARHAQVRELSHAEQVPICSLLLGGTGCVSPIAVVTEAARVLITQLILIPKADSFDGAARELLIPFCALVTKELIARCITTWAEARLLATRRRACRTLACPA